MKEKIIKVTCPHYDFVNTKFLALSYYGNVYEIIIKQDFQYNVLETKINKLNIYNIKDIHSHDDKSYIIIDNNNTLYVKGFNGYGQLGINSTKSVYDFMSHPYLTM